MRKMLLSSVLRTEYRAESTLQILNFVPIVRGSIYIVPAGLLAKSEGSILRDSEVV